MKTLKERLNIVFNMVSEGRNKKEKEPKEDKDRTLIDKVMDGDKEAIKELPFKINGPCIYAFITDMVHDAIKIGFTDQDPEDRFNQWRKDYENENYKLTGLGYWSCDELTPDNKRVFFWDHPVHDKVVRRGFANVSEKEFLDFADKTLSELQSIRVSKEFFRKYKDLDSGEREELSMEILKDIIDEMKKNIRDGHPDFKIYSYENKTTQVNIWREPVNYENTDLQNDAIRNGVNAILDGKKKLLMAAVMRFGKTHACYEIVKELDKKHKLKNNVILVTSAKADVRDAWREDINHINYFYNNRPFCFVEFNSKGYRLIFKQNTNDIKLTDEQNLNYTGNENLIKNLVADGHIVIVFATLHDLAGSTIEIKGKHRGLVNTKFDMMIVDETHYGSHASKFSQVTKLKSTLTEFEYADIEDDVKNEMEEMEQMKKTTANLHYDVILQVSGTPYYILASNEMFDKDAEIISKVSYTDMLEARDKWPAEHPDKDPVDSPYFGVPTLNKIGLRLSKECREILRKAKNTTSLSALFELKRGKLKNEDAIKHLMQCIFKKDTGDSIGFLDSKELDGDKKCKHTIMVLPYVKVCEEMKKLLENDVINPKIREVICIVGNNADTKSINELNNRLYDLDNKGKKSLILTVNKYLTGVTFPLIDSMIYMKNANSPQEYDQAIFRLCSRNIENVEKDENDTTVPKKINLKRNVYLIDFNIENMFNMIVQSAKIKAAANGSAKTEDIEQEIEKDLNAIPIYSEITNEGFITKMHQMNPKDLMARAVHYNKELSVEKIVENELDVFSGLFSLNSFQDMMKNINITGDKGSLKNKKENPADDNEQEDTLEPTNNNLIDKIHDAEETKEIGEKVNTDNKIVRLTKEKFTAMAKHILYCNLCLDESVQSLDTFIEKANKDNEIKEMIKDFRMSMNDLELFYNYLKNNNIDYLGLFNNLMLQVNLLMSNLEKGEKDAFTTGIADLGKMGKSEYVTPSDIVKKMCNKLERKDFESAESILLVNEKAGEFLTHIYDEYGKDVANKCRIVPSSRMTKKIIEKIVNKLGLNDYIILNIADDNDDGQICDDFLNMNNEEIMKKFNNGKKFDVCLMNPPYPDRESGGMYLDMQFTTKCNDISNIVISVQPANRVRSNTNLGNKMGLTGHLYELDIYDVYKIFKISTAWKYIGIYTYYNNDFFNKIKCINNLLEQSSTTFININKQELEDYYNSLNINISIIELCKRLDNLRKQLFDKYKTMVNDGHGFIYEENRLQRGKNKFNVNKKDQQQLSRVKEYLKTGKYKYCLYKGSFNHDYDEVQEWKGQDPDKLFKGQICWLTNKENVKNNIKYWMECPLFDLWRRYYLNNYKGTPGCSYGFIPALNFEQPEDEFKKYVDSLNNFSKEEITELIKFKVHNADKL